MIENEQIIKALTEREKCRSKISIWFESKENYYHPVLEVIVNGIDEIVNNFDKGTITVKLHDDCETITIKDTGRGIPINEDSDGVSNVELLFLTLFAGGKYDQEDPNAGLNGCGNTVTCYTSDYFKVKSNRTDGNTYEVEFKDGGTITKPLTKVGRHKQTGTEITFKLSNEVYSNTVFDPNEIEQIVKRFSACSNKVTFIYEHKNEKKKYSYKNIREYYDDIDNNCVCTAIEGISNYNDENEFVDMNIVLGVSTEPKQVSFLNNIYLRDGGTINDGIINGIRLYVNKYLKNTTTRNKHKKVCSSVTNEDVANSISFVANVISNKVEYRSQAKFATEKRLYKTIAQQCVTQMMTELEKKTTNFDKFMSHLCAMAKFNQKAEIDKKKLKKQLNNNINNIDNRVAKLVDCKVHGEKAQLFIAEGQSALGSLVLARDAQYQACYAIRGKILNCLKSTWAQIFENEIITDLIKVLGCGTEYTKDFDIEKLRFGEIIIATDQDFDGFQIQILCLTLFYKLMPKLIEQGKIRILQTPLFEIDDKKTGETLYAKTEKEKDEICSKLEKYELSRNKGLGEVQPIVMNEFIKDTSNSPIIECMDIKMCEQMFNKWMSNEVEERKKYIEDNLYKFVDLSE